jgi:hypothetical protein
MKIESTGIKGMVAGSNFLKNQGKFFTPPTFAFSGISGTSMSAFKPRMARSSVIMSATSRKVVLPEIP